MTKLTAFFNVSSAQLYNVSVPFHSALNACGASLKKVDDRYLQSSNSLINRVCRACEKVFVLIKNSVWLGLAATRCFVFFLSHLKKIRHWEKHGCHDDLNLLSLEERSAISKQIHLSIEQEMSSSSDQSKLAAFNQIMSYYARSKKIYGPIVRFWVEKLLAKAVAENASLVFMARDGIAPHNVALRLLKNPEYMAKFPGMNKDKINLVFLSRNVISWSEKPENQAFAIEYLNQEITKTDSSKLLFVDVGFAGSMIDRIKALMNLSHHAGVPIGFEYLISHTNKASGFLGDMKKPLQDIESAGLNPAVHWLEDSHQGIIRSPKTLVKLSAVSAEDSMAAESAAALPSASLEAKDVVQREPLSSPLPHMLPPKESVVPNTLVPGISEEQNLCTLDPLQKLLRLYSSEGCEDGALEISSELDQNREEVLASYVSGFENTLKKIKNLELPIFIEHS